MPKSKDPRRHGPPHPLLCLCQWCVKDRDILKHGYGRHPHWVPGELSPLEAENKRLGKTLQEETDELFGYGN